MSDKYKRIGVILEPWMWPYVEARKEAFIPMSFAGYVRELIREDLRKHFGEISPEIENPVLIEKNNNN